MDHYHCPLECEHPQPFIRDGRTYCGRCYFKDGCLVECVLCNPTVCPDEESLECVTEDSPRFTITLSAISAVISVAAFYFGELPLGIGMAVGSASLLILGCVKLAVDYAIARGWMEL